MIMTELQGSNRPNPAQVSCGIQIQGLRTKNGRGSWVEEGVVQNKIGIEAHARRLQRPERHFERPRPLYRRELR